MTFTAAPGEVLEPSRPWFARLIRPSIMSRFVMPRARSLYTNPGPAQLVIVRGDSAAGRREPPRRRLKAFSEQDGPGPDAMEWRPGCSEL
jgi:hypothetical protein